MGGMKMANERKNLNGLTEENKQSVAGGDIYYACGRYYVPDPSGKFGRFWKAAGNNSRCAAEEHEKSARRSSTIHKYATIQEAKNAADEEGFRIANASPMASGWEDYPSEDDYFC